MRPHQISGVKFMYECVMGLKGDAIKGCLLADGSVDLISPLNIQEMGLGKTLQSVALVWTLLKQVQNLKSTYLPSRGLQEHPQLKKQSWYALHHLYKIGKQNLSIGWAHNALQQ